jgi:hypothetical protein
VTHINPAGLAAKVDSDGEKVELGMTLVKVNDVHVPPHYGESVLLRADFTSTSASYFRVCHAGTTTAVLSYRFP